MANDKPTCMRATTDRILRRARNLVRAIHSYSSNAPVGDVALLVTCKDYDELKSDQFLWESTHAYGPLEVRYGNPTELRLYGVLVLPHE